MGRISRQISTEGRLQNKLLNIACWNVNGLKSKNFNKLEDQTFLSEITQHDIIGLIETHAAPTDIVHISGYQSVSVTRTKIKKARKHSGGIVVYIKDYLRPGVKVIEQTCSELVWLKLEKGYF
jgi:exonuclease III